MTRPRLYEASAININLETEIKRLYYQANLNPQKEARVLAQFGLRDGMSVLEVASGPGFVTEWLTGLIPNGSVTCLEIDPVLIEQAEEYLRDKAKAPYRIVQGSVMNMDLPDDTFDFAFVRFLFGHLEDPVGAAKEIMRVLKPGGKLVVTGADFTLNDITDPYIPEVQPLREKLLKLQLSQGGNGMIGRRLWPIIEKAGFENLDLETVISHSGKKGLEWFYPNFNPDRLLKLVDKKIVSKEEEEVFVTAVNKFMSSEESFYMKITIMACGQKPSPSNQAG